MLFENEIAKVGYLSRSVPEGIDLKEAILKMKVEYRLNNKKEFDRIFSLTNKVNQFIFT